MEKHRARKLNEELRNDPRWTQFQQIYPSWDVRYRPLVEAAEVFYWKRKLIFLDMTMPDPFWRFFHAVGHVVKHADACGRTFTAEEEREADEIADCMMSWGPESIPDFSDVA